MKTSLKCIALAGVCVLCYFLFEPIFLYNLGWNKLPNASPNNLGLQDSSYASAIISSRQLMDTFIEEDVPSISIAVGVNNKLVWSESRGYANIEDSILASSETIYRIGSVSKAVTSVALGSMLEQGKLQLDDQINKYLPEYPYETVTIRQLASHTSGIRNYGLCLCFPVWEYNSNDHYGTVEESLNLFISDQLLFEPGTDFSYSSYNFILLSAVLEKVYGDDFYALMKQEVFNPLQMNNTTFDFNSMEITSRATFYDVDNGEYKRSFHVDNSNKWAGGGIVSTPPDLVKLGNALVSENILNKRLFDQLITPQRLSNGEVNEQNYALGWRRHDFELLGLSEKVTVIHHGGTAMGSTALWLIVPEHQITMAIMMNKTVQTFPFFDLVKPILAEFVKQQMSLELLPEIWVEEHQNRK